MLDPQRRYATASELQADIVRVLDRYDNQYDRLVDLLTHMLSHREQWIGHLLAIRAGLGFDRQALEDALARLVESDGFSGHKQGDVIALNWPAGSPKYGPNSAARSTLKSAS